MIDQDTVIADLGIPHLDLVLDEIFNLAPQWVGGPERRPVTVSELARHVGLDPRQVIMRFEGIVAMMQDIEWTAEQLKTALDTHASEDPARPILLDVRQRWEYDVCHIPGSILLAESNFAELLPKLKAAGQVVTICHHGVRSFSAAMYLRENGVASAVSLAGGVEQWASSIDPSMPKY
jgi:rhodanese-related sulfurtransferase